VNPIPPVNIVHLIINDHGPIFAELIDLLTEALTRLGASVTKTVNHLYNDRLNLLIGHTVFLQRLHFDSIRLGGSRYIVFQTEALDDKQGLIPRVPLYLEFLRSAPDIWDYSQRNIQFLQQRGCRSLRHIPLGSASSLECIAPAEVLDIDVLFYGQLTPRRQEVLRELERRGCRAQVLFGTYGSARDQFIARSKIILNMHQFETSQLEQVRLTYLLNNRRFVISESADENPYGDGVVYCPYADLAACCESYLHPEKAKERARIAQRGYEALKAIPMADRLKEALMSLVAAPRPGFGPLWK
jgi:hypothetical protein